MINFEIVFTEMI